MPLPWFSFYVTGPFSNLPPASSQLFGGWSFLSPQPPVMEYSDLSLDPLSVYTRFHLNTIYTLRILKYRLLAWVSSPKLRSPLFSCLRDTSAWVSNSSLNLTYSKLYLWNFSSQICISGSSSSSQFHLYWGLSLDSVLSLSFIIQSTRRPCELYLKIHPGFEHFSPPSLVLLEYPSKCLPPFAVGSLSLILTVTRIIFLSLYQIMPLCWKLSTGFHPD